MTYLLFDYSLVSFFNYFFMIFIIYFIGLLFIYHTAIPDKIIDLFKKSNVVKYMKACKEINVAFIPYEEQVNFPTFF